MVIIHILIGLIHALLRVFATALLLLFSTAITAIVGISLLVFVVLLLTGTISFGVSRRRKDG